MIVVLTYDIDSKHAEVKGMLIEKYGYDKTVTGNIIGSDGLLLAAEKVVELPNTTLCHSDKPNIRQAALDLGEVVAYWGAKLEKFAVFQLSEETAWLANALE